MEAYWPRSRALVARHPDLGPAGRRGRVLQVLPRPAPAAGLGEGLAEDLLVEAEELLRRRPPLRVSMVGTGHIPLPAKRQGYHGVGGGPKARRSPAGAWYRAACRACAAGPARPRRPLGGGSRGRRGAAAALLPPARQPRRRRRAVRPRLPRRLGARGPPRQPRDDVPLDGGRRAPRRCPSPSTGHDVRARIRLARFAPEPAEITILAGGREVDRWTQVSRGFHVREVALGAAGAAGPPVPLQRPPTAARSGSPSTGWRSATRARCVRRRRSSCARSAS